MKLRYGTELAGFGASWVVARSDEALADSLKHRLDAINKKNSLLQYYPHAKPKS
jgi:hypothetical protein